MLELQSVRTWIAFLLVFSLGTAFANGFSSYTDESELFAVVKKIPASDRSANAAGYARLLALNPNRELYWAKFEKYSGRNESALLNIVKRIPASNRSANAAGYARLMALDPNNQLYRAKFEKYSGAGSRPTAVTSVSGLGTFIAGSWCVLDNDPTYVAGPYVEKLVVLADGSYTLFSKQAAAMAWGGTKEKGRFIFDEGRYSSTGEKYFSATPETYGSPKLLVDAGDFAVSWHRGTRVVGDTARNSCGKFE